MESIISIVESSSKDGGLNIKFNDGVRDFNYHLVDDDTSPRGKRLKSLIKDYDGDIRSKESVTKSRAQAVEENRLNAQRLKVDQINKQLSELGSRQIKDYEEIENAKAFIIMARAKIFEDNEGA